MTEWIDNPVFVLALISAAVALIWKFGGWYNAVNTDRTAFKSFMESIHKDMKEFRESIHKDIEEIRGSIQGILVRLEGAAERDSPLRLTNMGEGISERLDVKKWADRIASEIKDQAKGKQNYEIQEISFGYVNNEFQPTEELDRQIRACAYDKGIHRDSVLMVFSIELRDKLLELAGAPVPGSDEAA